MICWLPGLRLRIVRAVQVKQYNNWPGARVVCFAGHKNFGGDAHAAETRRIEMRQQSGEYFVPNSMLSSFGIKFSLKFGGEDKKN